MRIIRCEKCGEEIALVRNRAGKHIACDPILIPYKVGGYVKLYEPTGREVRGYINYRLEDMPDGLGMRPHSLTCVERYV